MQYFPARRLLASVQADEAHVIGASVMHGSAISAHMPSLVWCATTIGDERRVSRRGRGLSRAVAYNVTLPLLERLERAVLTRASRILAMSAHTAQCLVDVGADPDRIEVVPVPIDTTHFDPGESERRGVLFVGRVNDPRKGFDRLRSLVASSDAVRKKTVRVIAPVPPSGTPHGEGFVWLGEMPDLADAYRSAEVLVLPSRQEGLGIVAFEALSSGTPVVATRCGGPDVMLEASGGAVVVDDPTDLRPAIERILSDRGRRDEMGYRGRAWVAANMSAASFLADDGIFRLP
jgi:glycosyltransferase involved in cell wall biosynthesis